MLELKDGISETRIQGQIGRYLEFPIMESQDNSYIGREWSLRDHPDCSDSADKSTEIDSSQEVVTAKQMIMDVMKDQIDPSYIKEEDDEADVRCSHYPLPEQ